MALNNLRGSKCLYLSKPKPKPVTIGVMMETDALVIKMQRAVHDALDPMRCFIRCVTVRQQEHKRDSDGNVVWFNEINFNSIDATGFIWLQFFAEFPAYNNTAYSGPVAISQLMLQDEPAVLSWCKLKVAHRIAQLAAAKVGL